MLELLLSADQTILPPDIRGEITITGTYTWVCPKDVTSVCFVIISRGQDGYSSTRGAKGGDGGGLKYRNDVTVVPGNQYQITVEVDRITAFGTMVGQGTITSGPADGGSAGGIGQVTNTEGTSLAASGRGGVYTGTAGNNSQTRQVGSDLYGRSGILNGYGSGGYGSTNGNGGGTEQRGLGGACRIMWGRGRRFPNNAL